LVSGSGDKTIKFWSLPGGEMLACPFDLVASPPEARGITYQLTDASGQVVEYTLPCGAPIPQGAVCTCNCVAGGYVPSGSGGSHYWYPN